MSLIDKDHPVWKLAQSIVALALLYLLTKEGIQVVNSAHSITPDFSDIGGMAGLGIAGKLIYQYFKS